MSNHNEDILKAVYYSPGEAGSFGGVDHLFRDISKKGYKGSRKDVASWLADQDSYSLHKPARVNFRSNRVVVGDVDQQWQADLVDMSPYSKHNGGMSFILTVIDILSKFAWAQPLKDKSANEVARAFKRIFAGKHIPQKLQTDRGKEFLNKKKWVHC